MIKPQSDKGLKIGNLFDGIGVFPLSLFSDSKIHNFIGHEKRFVSFLNTKRFFAL